MKSIFLSFFLLSSIACCGQAYKYHFRFINLPENFKSQFISLVDEDAAGMLWFVTNNGLHRYDGNQVLTFDMQSTPALPDVNIRFLFADSRYNLWIATRKELVRFDLQQWTVHIIPFQDKDFPAVRDRFVSSIAEGLDGTIYTGFGNGKLYRIAADSLRYITHLKMPGSDTISSYLSITTIQEKVKGEVWLTTSKGQIISIHHLKNTYNPPQYYEPAKITGAAIDFFLLNPTAKSLVYAETKGAFLFDTQSGNIAPLAGPEDLPTLQHKNIFATGFENGTALFFYTGNDADKTGLGVYNPATHSFENISSVYPPAFRSSLFRGIKYRNGQVFIPNNRGIAAISFSKNAIDVCATSLETMNSIRTIFKVPRGNLLIGSYLLKSISFNETSNQHKKLSDDMVSCILPWNKDTLLADMKDGQLDWYFPTTNRIVPIFNITANPVNLYLNCLLRESDTCFWAGTNTGFYLMNPYTRRILKSSMDNRSIQLQQSVVYSILKAGNYRFFATQEGLFKYNILTGTFSRQLTAAGSNYANSSFSCLQLVNNEIWAGTLGNGILIIDTAGNLRRKITTADGLAGNIVFSNPVCKNYVVAGTGSGLSMINIQSGKIINYSSQYYLPSNEFNRSAWYVSSDTVYMGTINGFARIDMNGLLKEQNIANPGICFSGFTLSNGLSIQYDYTFPYRKNVSLTIPPDANYFSIGFGGLSEIVNGLKLYYRLSTDAPWQDIGQRREITFVNIAPDNYTMQIAVRLPDGQWIENVLMMPITVKPHFYQTWWFKALLFAIALGLIGLGIKYRERALLKEQKLRSRIAGDLHDEVGSALTRIYFQADMLSAAASQSSGLPAQTSSLQKIASSSQEALSSMSDMVWSIDAHYDTAAEMVGRMKDYLARLQDELDYRCAFEVTGKYEGKVLGQISRQNIFLIFKEAVNNAIKYGAEKKIYVNILFREELLLLTITNKTAPQETVTPAQGGHGLQNMQLRAAKIKGTLATVKTDEEFIVRLTVKS